MEKSVFVESQLSYCASILFGWGVFLQGIVCSGVRESWVEVYLVENAPWNIGSERQEFIGVGAHLFAIACKRSFEAGCEGYVAFDAKTGLVDYYVHALREEAMGANRLFIATPRAKQLVDTYFEEGGT